MGRRIIASMESGASLDGRCDVDMILQREIRNGQQKCRVASLAASILHNILRTVSQF